MDINALKVELAGEHPNTGPYDADDAAAAVQLNKANRPRNRASMTGSEVLNAVDVGEWAGLDAAQRQMVWDVVHIGIINPFGMEAALFIGVFGVGSNTLATLNAARVDTISRAVELGLGQVRAGDVQRARAA